MFPPEQIETRLILNASPGLLRNATSEDILEQELSVAINLVSLIAVAAAGTAWVCDCVVLESALRKIHRGAVTVAHEQKRDGLIRDVFRGQKTAMSTS